MSWGGGDPPYLSALSLRTADQQRFKDPNRKLLFSKAYQHVCTYGELYYKTFEFPDCLPGVDPVVTYPVALRCHCGGCAMATSDCTFESLQPDFCINNIPFYH
ncbi:hypothetical protein CCH79_00018321 [Gambusia affinis]|uniref:Gonadotropin subunit beta-2 n=1 Tax=Gambusia affinis TaxID=33528 RepID=A0A315VVM1_GAMAF|nr:hypothetical protein CCH79_00018321 [Gambusia affinis]